MIPTLSSVTANQLKQSYILFRHTHWSVLKASGPTVRQYLQGQITQDMNKLNEQQAIHSCVLSPQGKAISEIYILQGGNRELILLTPTSHAVATVERLRQFSLGHQLRIGIVDTLALYALSGNKAVDALAEFELSKPNSSWLSCSARQDEDIFALAMPNAPQNYWIIANQKQINQIQNVRTDTDHIQTDERELEALRILQGFPRFGCEWDERLHPLNANLIEFDGVDFEKGCYVGQEVTSRMHWRGGIKKKLYHVSLNTQPSELPCSIRSSVNIGELKSAAIDDNGHCFGIALLPIEIAESDAKLTLGHDTNVTILEACHA